MSGQKGVADLQANLSLRDSGLLAASPARGTYPAPGRLGSAAAGRITDRRKSAPVVHQRHMPMEPKKFHIPRKNKEKTALFQSVSSESREYEDMKTILTSGFIDANSAGCFTYSNPRLVHSELLEKEFVEKRREMKADGRTDKELEESYCFLLTKSAELSVVCDKGLTVGQSKSTLLGNPNKGVYLSRYSDLLQTNPLAPGTTGELLIFKVIKGKVKSMYENMKIVQDPTPRFDSHIAKNASKVTSLSCYRAFELTQHYFYEYLFDELRERPRHVCPYAVVSFHVKGKDAPLSIKPPAPIRSNSQLSERSKECAQFTVWSGDLVKNKRVLFQIALRSSSTPSLPHRLPEKLDIGSAMRFDEVTKLVPPGLFSFYRYSSSKEVVTEGLYCSLLEAVDRNRSKANVTALLRELETQRLVLVNPLTDRGFLFLLSSVQMATPTEREETWKRSLQALFVFPESRDVSELALQRSSSQECLMAPASVVPRLAEFMPALHHSLVKAKANPPPNLSAGVELQTQEYLRGLKDGSVPRYAITEYDTVLDKEAKPCPPYRRVNTDSYLRSYLSNPSVYLLPVGRAKQAVEAHCGPERPQEKTSRSDGGPREAHAQKMQQLLDQILASKKNAETEVRREEGDGLKLPERKRKLEQKTAERALKYFKASLETGRPDRIPVGEIKIPASHLSLPSIMASLGLKDVDLREDGSEAAVKFLRQLKVLVHTANQNSSDAPDEGLKESSPFGRLAVKLGLPAHCDVDLRKQEELEEQTAGSVSSLEGFSPGSHSGEQNHYGGRAAGGGGGGGGRLGRKAVANEEQEEEEWEIPWVLIPITGLCSQRYSQRDQNIPQDPRFHRLGSATGITTATKSCRRSPAPSPERSPPPSYPSPEASPPPSPFRCSSPVPSPPNSLSQCPSPEPSLPPSPSQCPSPEPSPPSSPFLCPSPQPSSPPSPAQSSSPETRPLQSSSQCRALANDLQPVNEQQRFVPEELPGVHDEGDAKLQRTEEPSVPAAVDLFTAPSPVLPFGHSPSRSEAQTGGEAEKVAGATVEQEIRPAEEAEGSERREEQQEAEAFEQEPKRDVEVADGAPLSSSDLDRVVDKHLEEFSSDVQLLLGDEGVSYSVPRFSPSAAAPPQHLLPYASLAQFSPYVSFYNPCPPVGDYVTSLQDDIAGMLAELDELRSTGAPVDASLANTVSDFVASVRAGQAPAGRDGEAHLTDSTDWRNAPSPRLSSSDSTSACGSAVGPQGNVAVRTALHTAAEDDPHGTVAVPGLGCHPETGQLLSFKPFGSPNPALEPGAAPVPSTTHINSVIDQLEPNVLNNLVEIIKDIKRKSPQFYVHCTEPGDQVYEEVKEHLLNLGNVHQSPVDFLHQDNTDNGLLVIIKNKDIAAHIHQVPGLMSLKRHSSVVFVGVDSLDDIKNNSCIELFVSGGCIVSDELVLNPDVITHDRLAALLKLLEEHSSPESLWRWKIHCRTHKRLKEQARFRRDAANLLDLLSAYQKRQIIEFLPYHHCDMSNQQSPDLDCLIELQARYTQFRHTVYLTEHPFDKFPAYSNGGVIVAGMEEIQRSFSRLVGCHSLKDKQLFVEDLLAPKGLSRQLDHRDSGHDVSPPPAAFPDHIRPVSSSNRPREVMPLPGAGLPYGPFVPDQTVPGGERLSSHTSRDMEFLQQAIKELRAERLEQLKQLKLQQALLELQVESDGGIFASPTGAEDGHGGPPPGPAALSESAHLAPGRTAVAAVLDSVHSELTLETWKDKRTEDGEQLSSTGGRGTPGNPGVAAAWTGRSPQNNTEPSGQSATDLGDPTEPDSDRKHEGMDRQEEPGPSLGSPGEDDVSRTSQPDQEQPASAGAAPQSSSDPESRIPVLMCRDHDPKPAPTAQNLQQKQPAQLRPYCVQPQLGVGLRPTPHLPQVHSQHFHPGPLLGPLRPLGGLRGLLPHPPLWAGGLGPTGSPLVWGFQQTGMDLLGGFYGPAGPGGNVYRGGPAGRRF